MSTITAAAAAAEVESMIGGILPVAPTADGIVVYVTAGGSRARYHVVRAGGIVALVPAVCPAGASLADCVALSSVDDDAYAYTHGGAVFRAATRRAKAMAAR